MQKVCCCILLLIIVFVIPLSAQKDKKNITGYQGKDLSTADKEDLDDAEFFFEKESYLRALPFYVGLTEKHPKDNYYKYRAGICYLYSSEERDKAISFLKDSIVNPGAEILYLKYFLGRAYHLNYLFGEAMKYYQQFIDENPPVDKRVFATRYLEQCKNAEVVTKEKSGIEITNIGPEINSEASEYVPAISSDGAILIFTYRGNRSTGGAQDENLQPNYDGDFFEDIFISYKVGEHWLYPENIGSTINTKGHDANISLSPDGQTLFIFKSTEKDKGDIYVSRLQGDEWTIPIRLNSNINTKYWEGSCSISADGNLLYFSSEKPGGFGGRDIYVSKWENGDWGPAQNLGPTINTPYNDDAPFIHPDGVTLFFSSEGHSSMGGYDILFSRLENGKWTKPENMGPPVNTAGDERYYVLSADGETGFLSSDRLGGYGQQDIYTTSPALEGEKPVLALVLGSVKSDNKPAQAKIQVTDAETGADKGTHYSNSATGKYLLALTPGNNYKIAFTVDGAEPKIEYMNVKSLDVFVQVQQDIPVYTEDYTKTNNIVADTSTLELNEGLAKQIKKIEEQNTTEYYEEKTYKEVLRKFGEEQKDGVEYSIEIGPYVDGLDFDPSKYEGLGVVQKRIDADGNVIYKIGSFKTLLDAEIFKYKVVEKDTALNKNIIIAVDDNGQRKLIQQYRAATYSKRKDYVPEEPNIIKPQSVVDITSKQEYKNLVKTQGKIEAKGVNFKLEIGAVRDTNDFKLQSLSQYGKIEKKTYADGITRYTIGNFKSLSDADIFRETVAVKEPEAAKSFVTVVAFGERKTVQEHYGITTPTVEPVVVAKKTEPAKQNRVNKSVKAVASITTRATVDDAASLPCRPDPSLDFSFFVGKDLNDPLVYNKLMNMGGGIFCVDNLIYKVQIGAYRHPENFKYPNLRIFGSAFIKNFPDRITRFTMKEFKTLKEAEMFRQKVIAKGTRDAWITSEYQGNRMLLQDLIQANFFNRAVN